jgi:hypothetical protein
VPSNSLKAFPFRFAIGRPSFRLCWQWLAKSLFQNGDFLNFTPLLMIGSVFCDTAGDLDSLIPGCSTHKIAKMFYCGASRTATMILIGAF